MKKLTILLVIVMFILYGVRYYEDANNPRGCMMDGIAMQTKNKQLLNYAGVKKRGSEIKTLFDLVDTLNIQEVFPIAIRYGDVLPDSYDWAVPTTENLDSVDRIRDSAWYEVVVQDQLEDDGYLDTITIRAY